MTKRCAKCRKEIDAELFICPHCGAIYGEPVYRYKQVPKIRWRKLLSVLIPILLIFFVALTWKSMTERFFPETNPDDMHVGVGEQVCYTIRVVDQNNKPIAGVVVAVAPEHTDGVIQAETDENGYAFIFHSRDNTLRAEVIRWPAGITLLKAEPVAFGSDTFQIITLSIFYSGYIPNTSTPPQTQDIQREFTVKVVDSLGTPVQGAHVAIGTQPLPSSTGRYSGFSDENGQCSFTVSGSFYLQLKTLPNGYYSDWQIYPVAEGDIEAMIPVYSLDKIQPQEGKAVYTVALRMASGEQTSNASVILNYTLDGDARKTYAYTNEDGTVSFLCDCSDNITADVYAVKGAKQYAVQLKFQNGETYIEWIFH